MYHNQKYELDGIYCGLLKCSANIFTISVKLLIMLRGVRILGKQVVGADWLVF